MHATSVIAFLGCRNYENENMKLAFSYRIKSIEITIVNNILKGYGKRKWEGKQNQMTATWQLIKPYTLSAASILAYQKLGGQNRLNILHRELSGELQGELSGANLKKK